MVEIFRGVSDPDFDGRVAREAIKQGIQQADERNLFTEVAEAERNQMELDGDAVDLDEVVDVLSDDSHGEAGKVDVNEFLTKIGALPLGDAGLFNRMISKIQTPAEAGQIKGIMQVLPKTVGADGEQRIGKEELSTFFEHCDAMALMQAAPSREWLDLGESTVDIDQLLFHLEDGSGTVNVDAFLEGVGALAAQSGSPAGDKDFMARRLVHSVRKRSASMTTPDPTDGDGDGDGDAVGGDGKREFTEVFGALTSAAAATGTPPIKAVRGAALPFSPEGTAVEDGTPGGELDEYIGIEESSGAGRRSSSLAKETANADKGAWPPPSYDNFDAANAPPSSATFRVDGAVREGYVDPETDLEVASKDARGSALLQIDQTRLNSTRDLLFDMKQAQAGKL